jgi:hypothetical protein
VPRELSGKRQQRFQHGYVVLTNRRILLIQYKKLMLNFPWSTFAWSAVQPPSGVSDASVELGSDAHTADIYLHVTGGERAEALERAVAAQIAKAKRQAGKPGERVSATQQKQVTSRQDTRQEPVRDEQVGKPMAGSAARATPSRQHTDSKSASRPRQTPARQRPMPIVGWPGFLAHHHEGDVLDGHVTRIYDDHAGVSLVAGVDGTLPGKRLGRQEFVPGSGPRLGIGSAVRVKIEKIKQPDPPSWPRSKLQPNKTPLGELPVGSLVQAKSTTEGVASAAVWKVTGHEDGKTQLEIVKEVEYEPARRFSGGGKPGYTQSFRNNSRFAFAATPYDEAYVVVSLVEEIPPNDPTRRLTK